MKLHAQTAWLVDMGLRPSDAHVKQWTSRNRSKRRDEQPTVGEMSGYVGDNQHVARKSIFVGMKAAHLVATA
jgi:hypothetical protein